MGSQNNIEDKLREVLSEREFQVKDAWKADMDSKLNAFNKKGAWFYLKFATIPFILLIGTGIYFYFHQTDELTSLHAGNQDSHTSLVDSETLNEKNTLHSKQSHFQDNKSFNSIDKSDSSNGVIKENVTAQNEFLSKQTNSLSSQSFANSTSGNAENTQKSTYPNSTDDRKKIGEQTPEQDATDSQSSPDATLVKKFKNPSPQGSEKASANDASGNQSSEGTVENSDGAYPRYNASSSSNSGGNGLEDGRSLVPSEANNGGQLTPTESEKANLFTSLDSKFKYLPALKLSSNLVENSIIIPQEKLNKPRFSAEVYGGLSVSHLLGKSYLSQAENQTNESFKPIVSPNYGVRFSLNNTLSSGIEMSSFGENYLLTDTIESYTIEDTSYYDYETEWQFQIDSMYMDSMWVQFVDSTLVTIDSSYVTQIDSTLQTQVNETESKRRYSYLNIPFGYEFSILKKRRYRLALTPEVYLGIRMGSQSYDYQNEMLASKKIVLSYGLRASAYYSLSDRFYGAFHLNYRRSAHNTDALFERKYGMFSGQFGIGYKF